MGNPRRESLFVPFLFQLHYHPKPQEVPQSRPLTHHLVFYQYCWGGKVAALATSNPDEKLFDIAAVAHPAMVDPAEADGISVPYLLLASGEEDAKTIGAFEGRLKVPHRVETFADQVHGWMAARADLSDEHVKAEYVRGYQIVIDFLAKHWPQ